MFLFGAKFQNSHFSNTRKISFIKRLNCTDTNIETSAIPWNIPAHSGHKDSISFPYLQHITHEAVLLNSGASFFCYYVFIRKTIIGLRSKTAFPTNNDWLTNLFLIRLIWKGQVMLNGLYEIQRPCICILSHT